MFQKIFDFRHLTNNKQHVNKFKKIQSLKLTPTLIFYPLSYEAELSIWYQLWFCQCCMQPTFINITRYFVSLKHWRTSFAPWKKNPKSSDLNFISLLRDSQFSNFKNFYESYITEFTSQSRILSENCLRSTKELWILAVSLLASLTPAKLVKWLYIILRYSFLCRDENGKFGNLIIYMCQREAKTASRYIWTWNVN